MRQKQPYFAARQIDMSLSDHRVDVLQQASLSELLVVVNVGSHRGEITNVILEDLFISIGTSCLDDPLGELSRLRQSIQ